MALPRRGRARRFLAVSIKVLYLIVASRSSQDEAKIGHRLWQDSLAGIRLHIKYDPDSMSRIDTLVTVRGVFNADDGEAHAWGLRRALRIGMGSPHRDIKFRGAFCYMATGTAGIVDLWPSRMWL
jgi:hypothetical protein